MDKTAAVYSVFISQWQRSRYNVNGLLSQPFWTLEEMKNNGLLKVFIR